MATHSIVDYTTKIKSFFSSKQELSDAYGIIGSTGAKNLLKFPYNKPTGTYTSQGITCTINDDGTITVDGTTSSNNADFEIYEYKPGKHFTLKEGSYLMTGSQSPVTIYIFLRSSSGTVEATYQMNGATLNISEETAARLAAEELFLCMRVRVVKNSTVDNLTLFPMISPNKNTTWQPYAATNEELTHISGNRKIVSIKAEDGIESFYSKMKNAFYAGNCDVYIGKGDYIYSNSLIDTIRAEGKRGVPIGNGCKYYFETGANLYCEYTGTAAADIKGMFSPLDAQNLSSDFEIYNLNLVAKNVLYAVHDDAAGGGFCRHIYKDCYIELDNTALGSENGNTLSKALGGGCAKWEEIIIEDCVFKATNPMVEEGSLHDASYHGANGSTFTDAKIVVTGCWFEHVFRVSNDFENVVAPYPKVLYTNNSSTQNAIFTPAVNVESKAWNNVLRA